MENIDRKRVWLLILSFLVAVSATFLLLSFLSVPSTTAVGPAQAGPASCLMTDTLEYLVDCIYDYMPRSQADDGKPGFVAVITDTVQSAWRDVVGQMLNGYCNTITLPIDLGGIYTVTTFPDGGKNYCVLMETQYKTYTTTKVITDRVTHGWGTFIVNPRPCRELSIQIAHPIHDEDTATQGIGVFKGTNSRSFLMAGTHRHANFVCSACQHPECQPGEVVTEPKEFLEADVAHNVKNLFQPTVEKLLEFYNNTEANFVAIQFHGMGVSSCPGVDVYMTYGISATPAAGDKILELRDNLREEHGDWHICVPGDCTCDRNGTENVQGRLLNNVVVTDVCITEASSYSGKFIHIEQKPGPFRDAENWIDAINDTWPGCLYLPLVMRSFPATGFEYDVQGCLGSATATGGPVEIYVEGNDVIVHHYNAIYNCCAVIVVDFIDEHPLLKLIERETYPGGHACTCTCPYDISAKILSLPPGNYRVEVWNWDQSHRYGWAEVAVP